MVTVRPFRGLRPAPEKAAAVACPPYDVLNTSEARAMAAGNPNCFLRVNKAELEFDDKVDPYSQQVYLRGKENLQKFIKTGVLLRDDKDCFYIYRLTMAGRKQTGLVALTAVEEYNRGVIKKHEHTRPEKVKDRATHIQILEAQVGPVFCAFREDAPLRRLFDSITSGKPTYNFLANDDIRHELWVVSDVKTCTDIQAAFARLPHLYICDGHHRSAAAAEVARRINADSPTTQKAHNYFLNVIFPSEDLKILPYNRVIKSLGLQTLDELIDRAGEKFVVTKTGSEPELKVPHQFGLYSNKTWYLLEARPQSFNAHSPTESIDASILQQNFIGPHFGITDPKTDKRIDFVGGIRGNAELVKLVDSGQYALAVAMYPTTLEQLFKVADADEVMPPKSTWFEPKLRDGMVVALLND